MSPAQRDSLVAHAIDGLKYREIAERDGVAIGTVMSRINHARAKLQAANK
jgi:RNA polymerase sigma-70 factor (ECF subfamily)